MSADDAQMKDGMTADIEEMDRIIGQFLDFARPDGGEPAEQSNLASVAAEIVERFRRLGHAVESNLQPVPDAASRMLRGRDTRAASRHTSPSPQECS